MTKLLWMLVVGTLSASLALPAPVANHLADLSKGLASSSESLQQVSPTVFHLIVINEVYTNADGTLQYVELLATQVGQTQLAPTRVTSFNADGTVERLVFDFTQSFPGLGRNETLLLATRAFESVAGFAPDFVIPDARLSLVNGRVAFKQDSGSIVDAVAYGMFTGSNSGFGSPAAALPGDGLNSLTRLSNTRNNDMAFAVRLNSPQRNDGRSATLRGGRFMLALLSNTDEIIRFELATGNIVQRVPAGFDVKNASGIEIGTAPGVNSGNPFAVVTQVGESLVRLYDAVTLQPIGSFTLGPNDIGWSDVSFDGTNWIFSVPDGVVGDTTFQGVDLINMSASVAAGAVVKFDSLNLNSPDMPFDVLGGIGIVRPGIALVSGCSGSCMSGSARSFVQILISNNRLMRGPTFTTLAGSDGDLPGVSGQLVSVSAGNMLISVPGSADLQIINPRTGQPGGMLTISSLDFTSAVAPDNAITGLSSETNVAGPR